jgi:hypothetical protein
MVWQDKDGNMLDKLNARNKIPFAAPRAASGNVVTDDRPVP